MSDRRECRQDSCRQLRNGEERFGSEWNRDMSEILYCPGRTLLPTVAQENPLVSSIKKGLSRFPTRTLFYLTESLVDDIFVWCRMTSARLRRHVTWTRVRVCGSRDFITAGLNRNHVIVIFGKRSLL